MRASSNGCGWCCGRLIRDIERKATPEVLARQAATLQKAQRLRTQKQKDKNKLYAWHAPEIECIGKGKARQPYELGVKVGIAITAKSGLIVGARSFPGNPYDGDTLAEHCEQTSILTGVKADTVIVDLYYRGRSLTGTRVLHKGKPKQLTASERRWLKRRQAVEPATGHLKAEHRMRRCHLKGQLGDALNVVLAAAGYNLKWLMRWLLLFCAWILAVLTAQVLQRNRQNGLLPA